MLHNKNTPWGDIGWVLSTILLWYLTIYPFNGSYNIDDINMNFFALVILFMTVFAHVLNMVDDHRLGLLVSLGAVLELLVWERMMGFGIGATFILLSMVSIFLISYKHYPRAIN